MVSRICCVNCQPLSAILAVFVGIVQKAAQKLYIAQDLASCIADKLFGVCLHSTVFGAGSGMYFTLRCLG